MGCTMEAEEQMEREFPEFEYMRDHEEKYPRYWLCNSAANIETWNV